MRPTPPGRSTTRARAVLTAYAHPFELAVLTILGTSAITTGLEPASLDAILSRALVVTWVIANGLGFLVATVGVFGSADVTGEHPRRRAFYRALEKAGLYLLAGTTFGYAVAFEALLPFAESWSIDLQLGAIGAACMLRAGAIRKAERIRRQQVRELPDLLEQLGRLSHDEERRP